MKRLFIATAAMLMLFCGCAPKTAPLPEENETGDFAQCITAVQGIAAADVMCIEMFDGSSPPDAPGKVWCSDADVQGMINYFGSIRLTERAGDNEHGTDTPGGSCYYVIKFFDGSAASIGFALGAVKAEDGNYYNYTYEPSGIDEETSLHAYDYDSENGAIKYFIFMETDREYYAFGAPKLERMTEAGWQDIELKKASSAIKEPLKKGRNGFELSVDELDGGIYRISRTVAKGKISMDHVEYQTYSDMFEVK